MYICMPSACAGPLGHPHVVYRHDILESVLRHGIVKRMLDRIIHRRYVHQVSLCYLPQVRAHGNITDVLLPLRVYRLRGSPVDAGACAYGHFVQPQNGIETSLLW